MTKLKIAQDRVALLLSYDRMVKLFRVPKDKRVSRAQFAAMQNGQILQVCRDLYNSAPLKLAKKLERSLAPRPPFNFKLEVNRLLARAWLWAFHARRRLHA